VRAPRTKEPAPAPTDLQDELEVYLFFFTYGFGNGQVRYFQRSLIATPKDYETAKSTLASLVEEAKTIPCVKHRGPKDLGFRLFRPEENVDARPRFPIDPTIVAVSKPLSLSARSSSTGKVYPPGHEHCPVTGTALQPWITSGKVETS
jgi:hypothetical protein